jgi:hypothetical protein
MIDSRDRLTLEFRAGGFNTYPIYWITQLINFVIPGSLTNIQILILGRVFYTVLLPTATLIAVFFTARLFTSLKLALIAMSIFAFSTFNISKYWYPDTYVQFGVAGFLYFLLKITYFSHKKLRDFTVLGIFMAIAISTKYTTLFLVVPFVISAFVVLRNLMSAKLFFKRIVVFGFGFTTCFLALNFSILFRVNNFVDGFNFNLVNYGNPPGIRYSGYFYYLTTLLIGGLGIFAFILVMIGIKNKTSFKFLRTLIWSYPLILIFVLGDRQWVLPRNSTSMIPFLIPYLAIGLSSLELSLKKINGKEKIISKFFLFSAIAYSVFSFMYLIAISLQKDTRHASAEWIYKNLPRNETIGINEFCSGLSPAEVAGYQIVSDPSLSKKLNYYVLNSFWDSPFKNFYAKQGVLFKIDKSKVHFEQWNSTKLVGTLDEFLLNPRKPSIRHYEIIREFSGNGPDIFILKKLY